MPVFGTTSHYMPHLVIERRENREAIVDSDGIGREDYLGWPSSRGRRVSTPDSRPKLFWTSSTIHNCHTPTFSPA